MLIGAEPTKGLVCAGVLNTEAYSSVQSWMHRNGICDSKEEKESHVQASAYKKQLCIYGFVFFFLLTELIYVPYLGT